jgi:hypothetical protein
MTESVMWVMHKPRQINDESEVREKPAYSEWLRTLRAKASQHQETDEGGG